MPGQRTASPLRLITSGPGVAHDDILDAWDLWMRAQRLKPDTRGERLRIVRQVARATSRRPDDLDTPAILAWLADLPSANTTVTYYRALTAWHLWLIRTGHRHDDPMLHVPRPVERRRKKLPASTEGIARLFESRIRRKTRAMIALACYEGFRCCEIATFDSRRIDWDQRMVEVEGKGDVVEWIPLHPAVASIAATFSARGPWFPSTKNRDEPMLANTVSSTISRAMERAEVRGTAHSLRRWFANEMKDRGVDLVTVQELLRHADLNTTQRYVLSTMEAKRRAIHLLPDVTRPEPPFSRPGDAT